MPISEHLDEEGLCIEPTWFTLDGSELSSLVDRLTHPWLARGDFAAQFAANETGALRIRERVSALGIEAFAASCNALNDYGDRLARATLAKIPDGSYRFEDHLEDDGFGTRYLRIALEATVEGDSLKLDFAGTAPAARGNLNCPVAVVAAAAYFVLRCLMPNYAPNCAGCLRPLALHVPRGSLLDPPPGAAVAAGNVETSTRVVDVLCGALAQALPDRIPAAAQGTMNNLAMGGRSSRAVAGHWNYYETLAGGHGGAPTHDGASGRHSHMTNTLNTPIEVAERLYPLRIERYGLRDHSGGSGRHVGGDGIVRTYRFLDATRVSLITERRLHGPWGLAGGQPGAPGRNLLDGDELPGKVAVEVAAGSLLTIETPGGGGWGRPEEPEDR